MYRFSLSYAILSLSLLQSAWAGGKEGTGLDLGIVLDHTINTVVLIALISYFAGKKIKNALQDRADSIGHEIQEAKRIYSEAEAVLQRYQKMMDDFESERDQMLQSYREQGEKEKSELIADGKRLADKLQSDAERSIANELNAMQRKIENDLLTSSLEKAETLLKEKVNMMDHSRLTQDYLSQIEKRNHSA